MIVCLLILYLDLVRSEACGGCPCGTEDLLLFHYIKTKIQNGDIFGGC